MLALALAHMLPNQKLSLTCLTFFLHLFISLSTLCLLWMSHTRNFNSYANFYLSCMLFLAPCCAPCCLPFKLATLISHISVFHVCPAPYNQPSWCKLLHKCLQLVFHVCYAFALQLSISLLSCLFSLSGMLVLHLTNNLNTNVTCCACLLHLSCISSIMCSHISCLFLACSHISPFSCMLVLNRTNINLNLCLLCLFTFQLNLNMNPNCTCILVLQLATIMLSLSAQL